MICSFHKPSVSNRLRPPLVGLQKELQLRLHTKPSQTGWSGAAPGMETRNSRSLERNGRAGATETWLRPAPSGSALPLYCFALAERWPKGRQGCGCCGRPEQQRRPAGPQVQGPAGDGDSDRREEVQRRSGRPQGAAGDGGSGRQEEVRAEVGEATGAGAGRNRGRREEAGSSGGDQRKEV
jgi:hypothetical protein